MRHILFVCTANQCRSPMAAGLFQRQIEQAGEAERWQIASAGTWAENQRTAHRSSDRNEQYRSRCCVFNFSGLRVKTGLHQVGERFDCRIERFCRKHASDAKRHDAPFGIGYAETKACGYH